MCGRYQFTAEESADLREIVRQIGADDTRTGWHGGEIFPTNFAPVLLWDGERAAPKLFGWGFPGFQGKRVVINARSETADAKPMFRKNLEGRRCVVPSSGFYEWDREKRKYRFRLPNENALYLAGLWNEFAGERRFVILTAAANPSIADVHDRMPVVLPRTQIPAWLSDQGAVARILHTAPPLLERQDVSAQMRLI